MTIKNGDISNDTNLESTPTELSFDTVPDSPELKEKVSEIKKVLETEDKKNVHIFCNLAKSFGGIVSDDLRREIWPALLELDPCKADPQPDQELLESHPEYKQVVLDVNRSLKRFPPGIPYAKRVALQDQLTRLILRVISKYPHLRYYQGYHDVAVTFLLVVGEDVAFQIMERLSTDHLRPCMEPTMEKTSHLLNYIYPLIHRLHPALCDFIERSGVGTMFCLPWFLTWYGHSLNQYRDVVRLYDYFLASPPMLPLYLAAAIVVYRQEEIFTCDCDLASVHCLLSQLPDDLPFEKLLKEASELYENFPPESVETEVEERSRREAEKCAEETRQRALVRRRQNNERNRHILDLWRQWLRIPIHNPRTKYKLLIVTASVAFGIYAYLRSSGQPGELTL
uniref:Rab-GAP TBC domain-containing protein n=1 Tax=Clastoptera arizonana TaxID=38151 RepID=A0A1B6CZ04_9HEMI